MHTQKVLLDLSIVRIGLNLFFYKNIKKQQYAHKKSVAARLVDSVNLSKKNIYIKNNTPTQSAADRLVDSENKKKKKRYFLQRNNTHTQKVLIE